MMLPNITRRDLKIALASACTACFGMAIATPDIEILGPAVFEWHDMDAKKTDVGEYRQVIRQPTATLKELELHVTTLLPGHNSHAPHRHANEELVIIREGTVKVLSGGEWRELGPGSVVFNASNSLHALENIGDVPAVYHVINWVSEATEVIAKQTVSSEN